MFVNNLSSYNLIFPSADVAAASGGNYDGDVIVPLYIYDDASKYCL